MLLANSSYPSLRHIDSCLYTAIQQGSLRRKLNVAFCVFHFADRLVFFGLPTLFVSLAIVRGEDLDPRLTQTFPSHSRACGQESQGR